MARKSAHGQQLVAFSKTVETPQSEFTLRERQQYAFFEDGVVLKKRDVWFKPGPYDGGKPRHHSYGWKVQSRGDVARFQGLYAQLTEKGYEKDLTK